jgi:uncharacterized protein (DUF2147 family)
LMAKHYFLFPFFILATFFGLGAQSTDSPEGRWKTIDDETGETKSVVEIYEQDGAYYGRIAKIINEDQRDALCENCKGERKNKPVLGMVIVEDLKLSGDYWKGGTILDPEKGATYKLSAWYEEDPNTLFIRGKHWTGLYRTQQWSRE